MGGAAKVWWPAVCEMKAYQEKTTKPRRRRAGIGRLALRAANSGRSQWVLAGALTLALLVALAGPVARVSASTNPFADVPKGHWSYEALAQFARLGLVEGYSADAFAGGRVMTRYEMAWAVARLGERVKAGAALTPDQRKLLSQLQEEFAGELALVSGIGNLGSPGASPGAPSAEVAAGKGGDAAATGAGGVSQGAVLTISQGGGGTASAGGSVPGASSAGASQSDEVLGVIPGVPQLPGSFEAWSSLKLRPDPGAIAALSALPGNAGREAFSGGRRLSELLGSSGASAPTASGLVSPAEPGSVTQKGAGQEAAVTIPLEDGTKAELSLGGPPAPGGIAPSEGDDVVARLDLKYALSQLAIFRASYELVKGNEDAADDSESKARATTLLGIDYKFALSDSAYIKAGYTYSRITDLVPKGIEWSGLSSEDATGESGSKAAGVFGDYTLPGLSLDARKTTTSFGVGYTFGGTASIVLGYRLIDFQSIDPETMVPGSHRTNVATAELTIRF